MIRFHRRLTSVGTLIDHRVHVRPHILRSLKILADDHNLIETYSLCVETWLVIVPCLPSLCEMLSKSGRILLKSSSKTFHGRVITSTYPYSTSGHDSKCSFAKDITEKDVPNPRPHKLTFTE